MRLIGRLARKAAWCAAAYSCAIDYSPENSSSGCLYPSLQCCTAQERPVQAWRLGCALVGDTWVKAEARYESLMLLKGVAKLPFTLDCQNDL